MKRIIGLFLLIASCTSKDIVVDINPVLQSNPWSAAWISHPDAGKEYGVYFFHKKFVLNKKPKHFVIHVTADNRYVLYVNGKRITNGPATGDIKHWQFESIDIAPFLNKDSNTIAAVVWNYGKDKPWGQLTLRTAFLLQGNGNDEHIVNTDNSWKVIRSDAYAPCIYTPDEFAFGHGTGAYEKIDYSKYDWGWQDANHDISSWNDAIVVGIASMQAVDSLWTLVQRETPLKTYKEERFHRIVKIEGAEGTDFISGNSPLTIKPNSTVRILLDKGHVTTAFPNLFFSGGKGSKIKIIYNETLYTDTTRVARGNSYKKGNRSETENKFMLGLYDIIMPDGGSDRMFEPLAYRTYRFVQFDITTADEELVIKDYKDYFSAYPFECKASFKSSDTILNQLFEIGWRSVHLCSHETYVDCPYYEQLQYFGDLNITARASSYLSGDMRLVKQAIEHGLYSMKDGEILQAAYPANGNNIIPSFSISWIDILAFYVKQTNDTLFVKQMLPAVEKIMNWYENKLDKQSYLLGPMPYWNFVDCTKEWPWVGTINGSCEPPGTKEGQSTMLTIQYLWGLQIASDLMTNMNEREKAKQYGILADSLVYSITSRCWDSQRNLFADIPAKTSYSQHTNIMALATGIVPSDKVDAFIHHLLNDSDLVQASQQFRAYLHRGLLKYDRIDNYTTLIDPWRELIKMGCTTYPEYPTDDNRSETHAWTSFPILEMLTIICGIELVNSDSVVINPHPGNLSWVEGVFPSKQGNISVFLKKIEKGYSITIDLPKGLSGILKFGNKTLPLHQGKQTIEL